MYNAQRQAEDEDRADKMMKLTDLEKNVDKQNDCVPSYLQGTLCRFPVVYVPCVRFRASASTSVTLGWLTRDMNSFVDAVVQVRGADDAQRYGAMLLCFASVPVVEKWIFF